MAPRNIVRDPEIMSGRWRLEGTHVPIADIRRRAQAGLGRDEITRLYAAIDLSNEEIVAIMAFVFPAVRQASVDVRHSSATVHCECGESTSGEFGNAGDGETEIECPCGRSWRINARLERVSGPEPMPMPDGES